MSNTLYDLGKTTSLRLQMLIVTRLLHCMIIVTRTFCHVIYIKCQCGPMKISYASAEGYIRQEHTGLVVVSNLETW